MSDITSPVHTLSDVDFVNAVRARIAIERGLIPNDYDHFVPRPAEKKGPTSESQPSHKAA